MDASSPLSFGGELLDGKDQLNLVEPKLEDTFCKQTSHCDLVDFPTKILMLAKT